MEEKNIGWRAVGIVIMAAVTIGIAINDYQLLGDIDTTIASVAAILFIMGMVMASLPACKKEK